MSALVETLVTALALSGLAATCLVLLPHAPPRLKFAVAAAGLAAWLVPWGWIRIALPEVTLALPLTAPLADTLAIAAVEPAPQPIRPWLDASTLLGVTLAAATLVGLALFAGDCLSLRCCLRRWRANSRTADDLRSLLPAELAVVPAEIRVVANSSVAAASGYLRPTIWIGDRYTGERLRLIVVHEMWHVQGRDPLWAGFIAAVRRAYWWNPLVAQLARQAILMIEAMCDHRSAADFGKSRYITELASLVLAGAAPAPRLLATVQTPNLDVQRLRLLGRTLHLRARDVVVVAALGLGAAATAMTDVVVHEAAPALALALALEASPDPALSSTPTGTARATLLGAADANDTDLLDDLLSVYAYTPQQHAGELELVGRTR